MDKKYSTGLLGVILIGVSGIIGVANPESLSQWGWRLAVTWAFVAGCVLLYWQARILTRADKLVDERWEQISVVMARLAPSVEETQAAPQANETLSMRLLRSKVLAGSWARELVDMSYRARGLPLPKVEFDYVCELNLVNQSEPPITLEKFAAKIKIAGREWEPMKPLRDLQQYQTQTGADRHTRKDLPNLLEKIMDVPLLRGVGHRGFVGFTFEASTDELRDPVQVELFAFDAAGKRHETILPHQPEQFNDEITYSTKNIRGERS